MADPLSIAASIAGLVAMTAKIYTVLFDATLCAIEAPNSARSIMTTVLDMKVALTSILHLLNTITNLPSERKELIRLDHIAVTFTECVLTLSELEFLVSGKLIKEGGLRSRAKWVWNEKKALRLLPRVEAQKTCLTLMISVLQCETTMQALQDRDKLTSTLDEMLRGNKELTARMDNLAASFEEDAKSVRFLNHEVVEDSESIVTVKHITAGKNISHKDAAVTEVDQSNIQSQMLREFEALLLSSRVYTRHEANDCDTISIRGSTILSNTGSVLSWISLNHVSIIAVFRLPITLDDITSIAPGLTFAKLISLPTLQNEATAPPASVWKSSKTTDADKNNRTLWIPDSGQIKIVLVGDGVDNSKSRLLHCYVDGKYPAEYQPRIYDNFAITVMINDTRPLTVGLFDTAGQEDYDRLRPLSYPQTDVFLVCATIGAKASFLDVMTKWVPEIRHHCPATPFIIAGIKDNWDFSGLQEGDDSWDASMYSTYGKKLAEETGAICYMECDLSLSLGVADLFEEAITAACGPPLKSKRGFRF